MANQVESVAEFRHSVVDVGDNSTVVTSTPGQVRSIYVNTTLSAHPLPLTDNGVAIFTLPASLEAGSLLDLGDVRFEVDITVDPDDAATGSITVIYRDSAQMRSW